MAQSLAVHLQDAVVALVRASPLLRAQQTAAPIAAAHELESATDQRLIESENHFEGHRMGHGQARLTDPRNRRWCANPLRPSRGAPDREQGSRVTPATPPARAGP